MSNSQDFVIEDGVLKRYTGSGGEVAVPEGVTEIESGAFWFCTGLTRIRLPASLKKLHWGVFLGRTSLKTIDLFSRTITKIEGEAFDGCAAVLRAPYLPIGVFDIRDKPRAVQGFVQLCQEKFEMPEDVRAGYLRYIRSQRRRLYPAALRTPELLYFMLREKMIPLDDVEPLLEQAEGNTELTAALLDYQERQFTAGQRQRRQERKRQAETDLLFSNVLDPALAKEYWRYEKTGTGVCLLGYKGEERQILVPAAIGKDPVTAIGPYAFSPHAKPLNAAQRLFREKELVSAVLPDSVTEIGEGAFEGCAALTSVQLSPQIARLPQGLFQGCAALTEITVEEGSPYYAGDGGVLFTADKKVLLFCPAGKKGAYTVPETVERIADGAGPAAPGESAFSGCAKLKSISLPAGAVQLPGALFENCRALAAIEVEAANPAYRSQDGVLFSGDMTCLLRYPPAKAGDYSVPETVREIAQEAFCKCSKLTGIHLPEGLERIGDSAFFGCRKLEAAVLPDSLSRLGWGAFSTCPKLASVTLPGRLEPVHNSVFYGCSRELTLRRSGGET